MVLISMMQGCPSSLPISNPLVYVVNRFQTGMIGFREGIDHTFLWLAVKGSCSLRFVPDIPANKVVCFYQPSVHMK